jgi:hypothetical protein
MCINYRMNSNKPKNTGILSGLFGFLGKNSSTKNNSTKNNSTKNNNTKNNSTLPAANGVNAPTIKNETSPNQTGGMASVNFGYGPRMQQPSEAVMEWATTAGAPMPSKSEMRNVAHGGYRKTRRNRNKSTGGKRRNRNKTNGGKRRNRNRTKRNRRN